MISGTKWQVSGAAAPPTRKLGHCRKPRSTDPIQINIFPDNFTPQCHDDYCSESQLAGFKLLCLGPSPLPTPHPHPTSEHQHNTRTNTSTRVTGTRSPSITSGFGSSLVLARLEQLILSLTYSSETRTRPSIPWVRTSQATMRRVGGGNEFVLLQGGMLSDCDGGGQVSDQRPLCSDWKAVTTTSR